MSEQCEMLSSPSERTAEQTHLMPARAPTTVRDVQTAPGPNPHTAAATKAAQAVRLRRRSEAEGNPVCAACGGRTIQNGIENDRGLFWCVTCRTYPFGCGFGPDVIEEPQT